MAETALNEAGSSSQVPPPVSEPDDKPSTHIPETEFSHTKSNDMVSTSFQALNSRTVAENGGTSTATLPWTSTVAPSDPSATQPPSGASEGHNASSHNDAMDQSIADTASYGTRSRNRTGNARPNYAEDQDMDLDFLSAASTLKKKSAEPVSAGQGTGESKRAQEFARYIARNNADGLSPLPVSDVKDSLAGSKKRKAAGAFPQHSQTPPSTGSPAPPGVRKPVTAQSATARETNVLTFAKSKACLNKRGELVADDGTRLCVNDHVYLVCEPPGDPYYLCRVMEFLHVDSENPNSPVDSLRVNWYYRPRDVQRFNSDSRLVYGTMHSDMCPLTSLRGKCIIKHRSEIEDLDAYRKERDSFYFVQVFDRFIRRWYECIPVAQIINVPEKVKKALDERWKFVVVEIGRVKELTSAVKTCKRCAKYCASHDSVDCAICKNSYHMNCVQPPLPKKPSRGFAWACGPCSRASERKLEARNTPSMSGNVTEAEEEEVIEGEGQPVMSNDSTRAPSPSGRGVLTDDHPATQAEIALAKMWPMRYLGIHCRVEDALQYDDRAIYPRASSRLGPRHQANVNMWHGRAVELVKPAEIKKRYNKGPTNKKETKLTKETIAALEADREERAKRPKWVQDEPLGYVARGEDYDNDDPRCTAKLVFKMPPEGDSVGTNLSSQPARDRFVDEYMKKAKTYSRAIGVPPFGVNFLDKCLELLTTNDYEVQAALDQLRCVDRRRDLHEPVLTKAELVKFEEGVAKYGSEHRLIRLHMKTNLPNSDIVRFYYLWKKTPKGTEIWGNFGGRKGSKRKVDNDAGARVQHELAHDGDDSAFDNDKADRRNRGFECKFCHTTHSRQWRRAPGVSAGQTVAVDGKNGGKDKKDRLLLALCLRCAGLWRKYAIQWEDIDEVARKVAQGGGRAWKRRIDEELLRELVAANEAANMPAQELMPAAVPSIEANGEPPKKKPKTDANTVLSEAPKKKPPPPPKEPTPPPPPIVPSQPQWKELPCAVCRMPDHTVECEHCKLTVHCECFGLTNEDVVVKPDGDVSWICEQCQNDRSPQVSTDYACCLCLTEETLIDLVEPPKVSHKKKTDREREKERMEKELADGMRAEYRSKQLALNRPLLPREPLKRTTGNNWVHVYCAVWTPEIRFSNAKRLEAAEGFQLIPPARYEALCKLCKNKDHKNRVREDAGACVSCFQCHANFHASCAFEAGYQFGFDVTPVKGSRKDQITTATLREETGSLTAAIWCKEHIVKSIIHPVREPAGVSDRSVGEVGEQLKTALQVYVENYKQADLSLTGTVRKANLAQLTKDKGQQAAPAAVGAVNGARRESTANSIAAAVRRGARTSSVAELKTEGEDGASATEVSDPPEVQPTRRCTKCRIDVTPRWHPVVKEPAAPKEPTPPASPRRRLSMTLGEYADLNRNRAQEDSRQAVDITGAPMTGPPPPSEPQRQNIRFMAPGASGRAWEGMPDRFASRPEANGENAANRSHHALSVLPPRETAASKTNGDSGPRTEDSIRQDTEDIYHNHALPRYQNPAAAFTPLAPEIETLDGEAAQAYLCHRCFLKKKLDPTPPPPERSQPPVPSPTTQFPIHSDFPQPQSGSTDHNEPFRMPWDEPPKPSQPPPPHVNGVGTPTSYGQQHPPTPHYPPYGQQPNGYYPPPPHSGPPSSLHERHSSFGTYHGPPPSAGTTYPPPAAPPPRPSPMAVFPSASQPMPNGTPSPHVGQQPTLQSPPRAQAPLPQYHQYPPRHTESPSVSNPIPSMGMPTYHSSPQSLYARPQEPQHVNGQPSQPSQLPSVPLQQQSSNQYTSPHTAHVRPDSQGGQSTTPSGPQSNGTPSGTGGASASPSLRNLLSY